MASLESRLVTDAVRRLNSEIFDGPSGEGGAFILNPTDRGVLELLSSITAEQASAERIPDRATLAGHVNHLVFSLSLFNRWARGENPFVDAPWQESWRVRSVDEGEWETLRRSLADEAHRWDEGLQIEREWDAVALTGVIASAAHSAYHMGAIRQLLALVKPS